MLFNPERSDKMVPTFPKGISAKVNAMKHLEFELAFIEVAVKHVSHNTTEISPYCFKRYKHTKNYCLYILGSLEINSLKFYQLKVEKLP